jgi:hypothetical protein
MATSLDYFLEGSVMLLWVWDKVRVKESPDPCWFSWAILGVWPGALILGEIHAQQGLNLGLIWVELLPIINCAPCNIWCET